MRNVRFLVAYDGSAFYGWQRQDGFESVQQCIEEAIAALTGETVVVYGAGRTDSGVHALGQVANAHLETKLDDDRLLHALNAHLPASVVLLRLETCPDAFHAQYHAASKRYAYVTETARFRSPFCRGRAHWVREPLDLRAMRAAADSMVGERDFSAFASSGSPRKSNVRRVRAVRIVARRRGFAVVVEGSGFLYNMVRTIAGTLIEVGRGRLAPEIVGEILESGDRRLAGATAPAAGLYLVSVRYAEPIFAGRLRGPRGVPGLFQA